MCFIVDVECAVATQDEQVECVVEDEVAKRFDDRPARAEDAGLQVLDGRSRHASISRVVAQTWCANAASKSELLMTISQMKDLLRD